MPSFWGAHALLRHVRPRIPAAFPAWRWRRLAWSGARAPPHPLPTPHKGSFLLPHMPGSAHPLPRHPSLSFSLQSGTQQCHDARCPRPRGGKDSPYPRQLQTQRLHNLGQKMSFLGWLQCCEEGGGGSRDKRAPRGDNCLGGAGGGGGTAGWHRAFRLGSVPGGHRARAGEAQSPPGLSPRSRCHPAMPRGSRGASPPLEGHPAPGRCRPQLWKCLLG